ncbi:hypothetical protein BJ878DRAFT_523929 [Calycina marina]|uniref:Uncharacterized protein n=1 Tax=Calycina marina TaxID=1763456 RepID=A0A9P7YVN6_9HELO|nr:hypothetical protein BJ878DRAFT_523929 [Calycina marina]
MGLPVFVAPPSPVLETAVLDKVTASPRSTIRRQPATDARRQLLAASARQTRPRRMAGDSQRLQPPASPPQSALGEMNEQLNTHIIHWSHERQNPPAPPNMEVDGPLMPPVPEISRDSALEGRHRQIDRIHLRDMRRRVRRHNAPTLPYTEADSVRFRANGARHAALTTSGHDFSDRVNREIASWETRHANLVEEESGGSPLTRIYRFSRPNNDATERSPRAQNFLSRANARRIHDGLTRETMAMDGLGDRELSLSPPSPSAWDTLLRTITPDPQPLSAGSSFASTSVSTDVAASSNTAPASATTSMTSQEELGDNRLLSAGAHDCDLSFSESSDEDGEEHIPAVRARTRDRTTRVLRRYADIVADRPERAGQGVNFVENEGLGGMQEIILRLAARDDIPDEWWISAGLRREPTS